MNLEQLAGFLQTFIPALVSTLKDVAVMAAQSSALMSAFRA
jgi:hypothetical protein